MSTIKIYSQDVTSEPVEANAPEGEAFYWAQLIRKYVGPGMIQFTAEVACMPYLGYVAIPDNKLAAEWLIDQHARVQIKRKAIE